MENAMVHIYCGDGKGKTTCACGLSVRCAGSGGKVVWFQFLKKDTSGERNSLAQIDNITLLPGYEKSKFTFAMSEEEKEEAKTYYTQRMKDIEELVGDNSYDLLVLDECIGAMNAGIIMEDTILTFLKHRPKGLEVVLTGRNPSEQLLECADYVSNIQMVKHPYQKGIESRKMIEF